QVSGTAVVGVRLDAADPAAVTALVEQTVGRFGRIDLFCANAGITTGVELDTMSHVYAARAVVPGMLARGSGYLLTTASAAGLLTSPGDAPYAVSKHAAVGFAEWMAVTYGGRGIGVSVPGRLGVATPL